MQSEGAVELLTMERILMDMGGGTPSSNDTSNSTTATAMGSSSMFFSTQLPFTLLFSGWVISTSGQLAGAFFACFFLAISFQVLQVSRASDLRGLPASYRI